MRKAEIVNTLTRKYGFTRYLEIATPVSGFTFGDIDRSPLTRCERLIYRWRAGFDDGLPVTYRTEEDTCTSAVDAIAAEPGAPRYDVIFIDSYHTYDASMADLVGACRVLADDGVIVVHDCDPLEPLLASPRARRAGPWCGVTYAAFIDFVSWRHPLSYCTVDSDFGCGVIFAARERQAPGPSRLAELWRRVVCRRWQSAGTDAAGRFAVYRAHRRSLLNLITPDKFLRAEWTAPARAIAPRGRPYPRSSRSESAGFPAGVPIGGGSAGRVFR